jgi:beta-carotene ketolase (CrtO type)
VADKSYDAIVIGGGHHGTIIAPYLAKAGMTVGVFERQDRLGGGAHTEDNSPTLGFKQNFCAEVSRFYGHPAYRDFNLYDEGLHYVAPETGIGIVFDDETSFVGYPASILVDPKTGEIRYSEENVKKTYDQIAQFSKADAETYIDLTEKNKNKWGQAFSRDRYSSPRGWGETGAVEELCADSESGLEPVFKFMNVKQLAHYFFESPELRILFIRNAISSVLCQIDDAPGIDGLYGILSISFAWSPPSIPIGGTQAITDALVSAGMKLGVEYFTNSEVAKVLVENGVAKGIQLMNGTQIEAKHLVVADTGIPQLLFGLLGEEFVTPKMRRRLNAILYDRGQLLWGCVAVHESPQYKAAKSNPDVNRTFRLCWAPKDLRYFKDKFWYEICLMGHASRVAPLTITDSIWDPTRAPEGKHNVWLEEIACPLRNFGYREWHRLRDDMVENHLLPQWRQFAPNMTKENVIATRIYTPVDLFETDSDNIEGGLARGATILSQNDCFRGLPELADYRTPVKNLYMCGSSLPGGQGIARGSSYRCYRAIAEDLGLPRFWEERGL